MNSEQEQLLVNINNKMNRTDWSKIVSVISVIIMTLMGIYVFVNGPFTEIWDEFKHIRKEMVDGDKINENRIDAHETLDDEILTIDHDRLLRLEQAAHKNWPEDRDYLLRDPKVDPYKSLSSTRTVNITHVFRPWEQFNCLIKH